MSGPGPDAPALLGNRPRLRALAAGFAFGLLSALSYAPVGAWFLVFVAPVPLMLLAMRPGLRPGRAGVWAAAGVMPWWGAAHLYILNVSQLGFVPLIALLSAYVWLFVWISGRVASRWPRAAVVGLPVVWVGAEFLRGTVAFNGYAFYLTSHPLIESPGSVLAAPAGWLGAYFVTFLAAVVAAILAGTITRRTRPAAGGLAIAGVAVLFTAAALFGRAPDGGRSVRVGVVQSNIPQDNRASWTFRQRVSDFLDMRELTLAAAGERPDVIAWPEGMFPGRAIGAEALAAERAAALIWPMEPESPDDAPGLGEVPDYIPATELADGLLALQAEIGAPMVVGSAGFDRFRVEEVDGGLRYRNDAIYNSAFVVEGGRVPTQRYDKLHLAPFGEVMPYISAWEWLETQLLAFGANGMTFVLERGDDPVVLDVPADGGVVHVATPICFEATVSGVCRRLVFDGGERRAGVMLTLTNDGWFGDWTPAREHYALASRWRCVELGTPLVRVANTGISAAYDARGRVIADELVGSTDSTPRDNVAGVLIADVALGEGATVYARVGDSFGWAALGLTLAGLVGSFRGPRGPDTSGPARPADDESSTTGETPKATKE
ncbi:MAG: apolipoprotein N-acyltransferase [Phycisphaeraceae bacterium]|nr:MAG: apolipoprotein N-acyltransferase [Phycisphaeraceae bacterium]